jgi:adenine specific DNA methylase Mod
MESESVNLIYLDPPFFSGKDYEIIWGDKEETRSFGDRWSGGIQHYVSWMVERLEEMHRILKPMGSIYLHVDHHAVHYLKVEMDKIFGMNNFKTEITWRRCHPKGNAKTFSNNSDYILYYTKSKKCTFNIVKILYLICNMVLILKKLYQHINIMIMMVKENTV